jgi:hypothetical protein
MLKFPLERQPQDSAVVVGRRPVARKILDATGKSTLTMFMGNLVSAAVRRASLGLPRRVSILIRK